jgi:phosphatidylserine/phosphatidylglycerophosphate/cardiolipin synthase-like enzyme
MQINSYFKNIRKEILHELDFSTESIQVAVAWFTNHELFDKLCEKVSKGIKVELIIIDDEINNRIGGLNFQQFIKLGGTLIYGNTENPMHNKFCIIDNKVLISGSYNWTYFAENINFENITPPVRSVPLRTYKCI